MLKAQGKIKVKAGTDEIVGAWLSQKSLDAIGAEVNDFVYLNIGWSGTKSGRAHIKGLLPDGYDDDTLLITDDVRINCNFKEGDTATIWRHGNWM